MSVREQLDQKQISERRGPTLGTTSSVRCFDLYETRDTWMTRRLQFTEMAGVASMPINDEEAGVLSSKRHINVTSLSKTGGIQARMSYPRYAIYFTPPPSSPLAQFGASVLGYDCFERTEVAHPHTKALNGKTFSRVTTDPRKYGFHATLVAPFHLEKMTESDLLSALGDFTQGNLPIDIGPLAVDSIGAFIALKPETQCSEGGQARGRAWWNSSIRIARR